MQSRASTIVHQELPAIRICRLAPTCEGKVGLPVGQRHYGLVMLSNQFKREGGAAHYLFL